VFILLLVGSKDTGIINAASLTGWQRAKVKGATEEWRGKSGQIARYVVEDDSFVSRTEEQYDLHAAFRWQTQYTTFHVSRSLSDRDDRAHGVCIPAYVTVVLVFFFPLETSEAIKDIMCDLPICKTPGIGVGGSANACWTLSG
jgi:hypothetical protein